MTISRLQNIHNQQRQPYEWAQPYIPHPPLPSRQVEVEPKQEVMDEEEEEPVVDVVNNSSDQDDDSETEGASPPHLPSLALALQAQELALASQRSTSSKNRREKDRKLSKDEKAAWEHGIPPDHLERLISDSIDEFNDYMQEHSIPENSITVLKDIRRRGKNKVAAQNCRKRKLDQVEELKVSCKKSDKRNIQLRERRSKTYQEIDQLKQQCTNHFKARRSFGLFWCNTCNAKNSTGCANHDIVIPNGKVTEIGGGLRM